MSVWGQSGIAGQVQPLTARRKWAALALWAFSMPQMLKGCEPSTFGQDGSEPVWMWLLATALGVILLREGAKMVARPCLRALRFEGQLTSPVQVTVNMDRNFETASHGAEDGSPGAGVSETPRPNYVGARTSVLSGSGNAPRAASAPQTMRIPEALTAHFTSFGERWHQDPNCGDITAEEPVYSCSAGIALLVASPLTRWGGEALTLGCLL